MARAKRTNRKASDEEILRLNYVGYSLSHIAKTLGIHPTTVTLRLQSLHVNPADTRRTFMDNVLRPLQPEVADWLADELGQHYQIREFVRDLLVQAYNNRSKLKGTAYERHLAKYGGLVYPLHPQTDHEKRLDADRGALRGSAGDDSGTDAPDSGSESDPGTSQQCSGKSPGIDEA